MLGGSESVLASSRNGREEQNVTGVLVWCLGFFSKQRNFEDGEIHLGEHKHIQACMITLLYLGCIVYQLLMYSVLSCTDTKGGSCQLLQKQD